MGPAKVIATAAMLAAASVLTAPQSIADDYPQYAMNARIPLSPTASGPG